MPKKIKRLGLETVALQALAPTLEYMNGFRTYEFEAGEDLLIFLKCADRISDSQVDRFCVMIRSFSEGFMRAISPMDLPKAPEGGFDFDGEVNRRVREALEAAKHVVYFDNPKEDGYRDFLNKGRIAFQQADALCRDAVADPFEMRALEKAREEYDKDGDCEIDDMAVVSTSENHGGPHPDGAYVQAYVYVDLSDEFCRTCGDKYDGCGDGFDGECPSCADKTEDERLENEKETETEE